MVADLPWISAELSPGLETGTARGFASGSRDTQDQSVTVRLVLAGPPEDLRLGFGSTLAEGAPAAASWAVDNVQIVTTRFQPRPGRGSASPR